MMGFNLDQSFGIHALALRLRDQRSSVIASNLANADTPNYKARDLDFRSVLEAAHRGSGSLTTTHAKHQSNPNPPALNSRTVLYRVPTQPSLDGNTVETELEQVRFAQNALEYQASLRFLNGKIAGLLTAIKGE